MSHCLKFGALCLLLSLLGVPPQRTAAAAEETGLLAGRGALDEFDNLRLLAPAADGTDRLVLGDNNGLLHVYEKRDGAFDEVWVSDYLEGAVSGIFILDVNDDDLEEIVVFTDQGRFYYFDTQAYSTLWSNPPNEYENITGQTIHDVDDDPQPELIFGAGGRLIVYDGREQFEEWRSDQTHLIATDILVADVDGDGEDEIVVNDGYIFDARFRDLEWQSPELFGERMGVLDVDDDGILELVGEFKGRFIRIFDVDLRREKSLKP